MQERLFNIIIVALFSTGAGALSAYWLTKAGQPQYTPIAVINYAELADLIDKNKPKAIREKQAEELAAVVKAKVNVLEEQGYLILNASQVHYAPEYLKISLDRSQVFN